MNEQEKEQANRAAVLVIAALVYARSVQDVPPAGLSNEAAHSFEAAEIFVEEAKKRGNDIAAIATLGAGLV